MRGYQMYMKMAYVAELKLVLS